MKKILSLLALLLTICSGAWADATYEIATPSQDVNTDATSGITVVGKKATGAIDGQSNQAIFQAKKDQPLFVSSIKANIIGIEFDYDDSSSGSGTDNIMSISTATSSQFAVPTSGFTASYTPKGGSATAVTTLTGIAIPKDQSTHYTFSLSLDNAVSMLYVITSSSNAAQIRNLKVKYDDDITAPSLYATITPSGTTDTYNVTGSGSMTASKIGNTKMSSMSYGDFYQLTGTNTYTPAESLEAGDIVVFTLANASANTIGIKTPVADDDHQITFSKSVAKTPYQFVYVVTEDLKTVSFARKSSADYLSEVKVYHNVAVSHNVSAVTSTGDDTYGTVSAASSSVAEGKTTVITAEPALGYKVTNWAVSGEGASIDPSGESNSSTTTLTMGTGDATVTVTFGAAETYTISYNAGSAEGVTGSRADETKTESVAFTLPSAAVFTRAGYLQTGWNTNADGTSGTSYELGGSYTTDAAQTFYPEWTVLDYSFVPSASEGAISDGDEITTSTGGKMVASTSGTRTVMSYATSGTANLLSFGYDSSAGTGNGGVTVTLDKKMQVGTVITGVLYYGSTASDRSLTLHNSEGTKKATWTYNPAEAGSETFTYTVVANDGLAGSYVFKLFRKNSTYLQSLSVINCAEPASQDITVGATGFATIGLPFATTVPEGVTAYAVESVTNSKVKMSSAIAAGTTIPANKGYVIVASPEETYTFTEVAEAEYEGTNLLQAVGATPKAATTDAPIYVFAITDATNKKVGFKKATSGSLGAYKAYLPGNVATQNSLSISFEDEATAINGVAEEASDATPVKVVTAKGIQIGKFNVAGQQVK